MATICPAVTVELKTTRGCPPCAQTAPGMPSTSASWRLGRDPRRWWLRGRRAEDPARGAYMHGGTVGSEHDDP